MTAAEEKLVDAYPKMLRWAVSQLGWDAHDVVQDAYAEVLEGIRRGAEVDSPENYLFGTVRHLVIKRIRRRQAQLLSGAAPDPDHLHSPEPDPEAQLLAREARATAHQAILGMPGSQRAILQRYAKGVSRHQICTELGLPPHIFPGRKWRAIVRARREWLRLQKKAA